MDIDTLIQRGGGVRPLAKRLNVARTTVLDWKRLGTIPATRVNQISGELKIEPSELLSIATSPRQASAPAAKAA